MNNDDISAAIERYITRKFSVTPDPGTASLDQDVSSSAGCPTCDHGAEVTTEYTIQWKTSGQAQIKCVETSFPEMLAELLDTTSASS